MTRRAFLLASLALLPLPVAADERGSRRLARHNRLCASWAARRAHNGISARERAMLERRGCKEDPVLGWVSGLVFTAEDE